MHVVVELMDRGSLADLRRKLAGPIPRGTQASALLLVYRSGVGS